MRSKKVIYNILSNLLLQFIIIISGFIVPKIIISNYGSNVNGLIVSITQFLAYISLLESGFGPVVKAALYKPIAKKNGKEIDSILKTSEKFFRTISFIFILYIALLCLIYPIFINNEFDYLFTLSLIIIISISTFFEYYFGITYALFLKAKQKTYIISIIQILTYVLNIIIVLILANLSVSVHVLKLFSSLIFVMRPILQNIYVKKKYKINFKDSDGKYKLKQKWDAFAQHIAAVIHNSTDITILTIFCNLIEVSVYSVYSLVVKGIKAIVQAFSNGIDSTFGDMLANDEKENLNKKFRVYEVLYNSVIVILFTCAIVMIVPFVQVYTKSITDANYIRYVFGSLIVISEYIWAIRLPYSSITNAAGHFKETRIGAWVECLSNIIISIILVNKFGIIGVTIGTIVAMSIRTIEFMYHTNKYILQRNMIISIKNIFLITLETLLIVFSCRFLPYLSNNNYSNLIINALMVFCVAIVIVFCLNFVFYRKDIIESFNILKKLIKKK